MKQKKPLLQKVDEFVGKPKEPWKHDVLNRQSYADRLTNLISTLSQPYVMGIDATYGGGKTFFIRNWQASLEQTPPESGGYKTVYFNAWESDFSNDPLAAFISALRSQLDDSKVGEDIAKKIKGIIPIVAPAIAKHLASRYLGAETLEALKSSGGKEALDIARKLAEQQISDQEDAEKGLQAFKKEMTGIVEDIGKIKDIPSGPKLIIFVDELDRCRPSYAVEILERIKHFFSVPGILFVISADRKHLGHSFSSIYGPKFDDDGYLARFIDNWFRLPDPDNLKFSEYLVEKFRLVEDGILTSDTPENYDLLTEKAYMAKMFGACATYYRHSLRKQEQVFSVINIALRGVEKGRFLAPTLYPIIMFSMLEIPDDLKNSCQMKRMNNKFKKDTNNILGGIKDKSIYEYFKNYISAAMLDTQEHKLEAVTNHENDIADIQQSMRINYKLSGQTAAQYVYDDLKFWNAANGPIDD